MFPGFLRIPCFLREEEREGGGVRGDGEGGELGVPRGRTVLRSGGGKEKGKVRSEKRREGVVSGEKDEGTEVKERERKCFSIAPAFFRTDSTVSFNR